MADVVEVVIEVRRNTDAPAPDRQGHAVFMHEAPEVVRIASGKEGDNARALTGPGGAFYRQVSFFQPGDNRIA